ncbi:MAG: right-handed parallel beta-helix repeat-containing protein, partial [Acidimicrobiia bacterium]|nr:right-handed parallel beta-helix repeat-containing protein [Acidimicrobiia bacterium]
MQQSLKRVGLGLTPIVVAALIVTATLLPALTATNADATTGLPAQDAGKSEGQAGGPIEIPTPETEATADWSGVTRNVPDQYPTIQSAVDAAIPGDLILIQPGVYQESVAVTTDSLTLRGVDRNAVILDGEFTRDNGVIATADGVAIENMTARNYTTNGFFWTGVTGYRGSYLTSIDNWVYGIYAFDSVDGLLEHSYASGSWDAGFYVGQCDPCNAVVSDVVAEFNGLGYSGTNSSGNMFIVNSEWGHNVAGIVPNTLDSEALPPSHDVTIAGNYIHHSGEVGRAPSGTAEWSAYGNGVVLAGSRDSVVRNNLLVNNRSGGVQVVSMIDANLWRSGGNEVRDNHIRGSGRADLLLGGPLEQGSCFAGNDAASSVPFLLPWLHRCGGINLPLWYGLATSSDPLGRIAQAENDQNPQLRHGDSSIPKPDLEFEQMPGGVDAPVRPAVDVFNGLGFDPTIIVTPEVPADVDVDDRRPSIFGIVLGAGFWPVLYGALMWWVPMLVWLLGGAWVLAKLILGRINKARSMPGIALWGLLAVLLPVIGVLLFAAFGNRQASILRRLVSIG